jgi:hypothetical protein
MFHILDLHNVCVAVCDTYGWRLLLRDHNSGVLLLHGGVKGCIFLAHGLHRRHLCLLHGFNVRSFLLLDYLHLQLLHAWSGAPLQQQPPYISWAP